MTDEIFPKAECDVFEAMSRRHSVRAFLPAPVERPVIEQILTLAAKAPSGSNTQPWQVWVASGEPLKRLKERLVAAFHKNDPAEKGEFRYYPEEWCEPYISRRRSSGLALYRLLGIAKTDTEAMQRHLARNFEFFGAPTVVIVTIDQRMGQGMWLDIGGFAQSIMLAAQGFGLVSCQQQSISQFHRIIREELGIPADMRICCSIGLGHEDKDALINKHIPDRAPLSEFVTFRED